MGITRSRTKGSTSGGGHPFLAVKGHNIGIRVTKAEARMHPSAQSALLGINILSCCTEHTGWTLILSCCTEHTGWTLILSCCTEHIKVGPSYAMT